MKSFSLIIAALCLAGCASSSAQAPQWIDQKGAYMRQASDLKDCVAEVGSYKIGARGEGFARTQAGAAARSQLAQQMSTTVTSAVENYFTETQTSGGSYAEGTASDLSKAIADKVKLKGSEIYGTFVNHDQETVYALAVVCMNNTKLDQIVNNAATSANLTANDVQGVRERMRRAMQETSQ
jgi:hypothetical protein